MIYKLCGLVDKPEMVQVCFTLDPPKGTRHQKTFELMNNLHGILHGTTRILFHNLLDIALGPSKRGESNAKLGIVASN